MYDEIIKKAEENANIKLSKGQTIFYDNLSTMQMGLEADNVQEASTYKSVADYLTARNPKFEIVSKQNALKFVDNFALAMRGDGTLENLTKTYITDLKSAENPPAVGFCKRGRQACRF